MSIGTELHSVQHVLPILRQLGWVVLKEYPTTVAHGDRVYDWVNIECWIPPVGNTIVNNAVALTAIALNQSPGVLVWNLSAVDFSKELTAGREQFYYFDNNKNFFIPIDNRLPFGINSDTPDAYTFIGLSGPSLREEYLPGISIHTSPEVTIHSQIYPLGVLESRTAAVAYLTPRAGNWVYSETGVGLICTAKQTNLTGFTVPNTTIDHLLRQSQRYQFTVALIARRWRNHFGSVSADIFNEIVLRPSQAAERLGFDELESYVDHFFK